MRPRSLLLTAVALCGCLLPATLNAAPPYPVSPELTEPALFQHRFDAGTRSYTIELTFDASVSTLVPPTESTTGGEGTATLTVTVQPTSATGHGTMYSAVDNLDLNATQNGERFQTGGLIANEQGVFSRVELAPNGAVVDEVPVERNAGPFPREMAMLFDMLQSSQLEFPSQAIAVGDTWGQSTPSQFGLRGENITAETEVEHRFVGYAPVGDVVLALVESRYQTWIDLADGGVLGGLPGPGMGRGVATAYHYFNLETGQLVESHIDAGVVFRSLGTTEPVDVTMTAEVHIGGAGEAPE